MMYLANLGTQAWNDQWNSFLLIVFGSAPSELNFIPWVHPGTQGIKFVPLPEISYNFQNYVTPLEEFLLILLHFVLEKPNFCRISKLETNEEFKWSVKKN